MARVLLPALDVAGVRHYSQLEVWQRCEAFRRQVDRILGSSSWSRDWNLHDQLRRSSEAPCANVAEGFSRYQPRDFARFVRIARGSLAESIEHLRIAGSRSLAEEAAVREAIEVAEHASRAAAGLIRYLEKARPPT